jgi:hypothetical protein
MAYSLGPVGCRNPTKFVIAGDLQYQPSLSNRTPLLRLTEEVER